jgi:HTH-type transcriptional repressor of NAD biosynthesis genes
MDPIISGMKKRALYLLCDHVGVQFHQDGIRDGEHLRQWMTERFEREMIKRDFPYVKLQGGYEERFLKSVQEIEKILIR